MHHNKFYIAGKWVEPQSEDRWPLVNPATEQVVAHIPMASEADVNAAVAAAKAAFPSYSQTTVSQRIQWFKRLLDIYRANADAITDAMIMEIGCPRSFTHEVQTPCGDGHIEVMIEVLDSFQFEHPSPRGGSTIVHEPVGVCALITPWNWPINQVVAKVLPSLASGCTCVLKPSEESALSAILFAQMLDEAGFPAGAFNLINHHNEPVTEKDFLGKFMLVYFGYTYCPDVCPTDLQIMSAALGMVDPAIARDITPVFISIDPERDTVALMAQYIRHFHKNLIGLTGTVDQVKAIKSKYRVYSAKTDDTTNYLVDHTAYTYLMNKDGTLLKHFNHALPPEKMAKQIMALAR
jgi:cytochrome oxidase Cu insertion factor (SCO1/SenC/PrrC family)